MAPVGAGDPFGPAQALPARRPVHRAGKHLRIAERLGQQHLAAVRRRPVIGETAGHPRKEEGGEVREHAGLGENQETRVVRDDIKSPELLLLPPAAPAVARAALESAVLPRRETQPQAPEDRDIAQAAARQPTEAEIMMLFHQRVPERPLLRLRQADLDLRQGEPAGGSR